jgi:phosphoribosylformylglycinamidine synthase
MIFQGAAVCPRFKPIIQDLTAHYWYFVKVNAQWSDSQRQALADLLQAEAISPPTDATGIFWVVPRLGTISPWSSKATDIIQNCGLAGVERVERGIAYRLPGADFSSAAAVLHDPLTESCLTTVNQLEQIFVPQSPQPLAVIDVLERGSEALETANRELGLALSAVEIDYLLKSFQHLKRNPTDVELMMFAQVNSEHCRHKIFNAEWVIDEHAQPQSLFQMIRQTYSSHPQQVLVAYSDNAAVLKGSTVYRWLIDSTTHQYTETLEPAHIVLKVETHNHPTAISPFPGAATGSGGEIRDEAATGRGAYPKAGWAGFSVSHLKIPDFIQPWEIDPGKPASLASPLEIMLQAPLGAAAFNNEFGRPALAGYFRTFLLALQTEFGPSYRGYHKPIMIAGGVGVIRESQLMKQKLPEGALLIVLGGPAMAIGLGGGSASSRVSGENTAQLDFASVQRSNPEMQRRCQEVINTCWSLGDQNPILSIHDVGAGGLSNAIPEIVAADGKGAALDLRAIPNAAMNMTPMEIWCNEAQERFVLAIMPKDADLFDQIAQRERCPYAVVGEVTDKAELVLSDSHFHNTAVDMPTAVLFEKMPRLTCTAQRVTVMTATAFNTSEIDLTEAVRRVLQLPCVSSKQFLITIGDRSVTGLVARDQLVGPWQIPVSDVAVTSADYQGVAGEAMAVGERPPIALVHQAASARMAVGEAITNIAAARIEDIDKISLSANWMAAPAYAGEGAGLFDAVQTVALELCEALGICIPVGKDSLSMRTVWEEAGQSKSVTAPLSLVITAAAPVLDVRATLTPQLRTNQGLTRLILLDLGEGSHCMAGSALEQVYQVISQCPPDVDNPDLLKQFFRAIQALNQKDLLLAYHDRSDGGLLATVCEMMFAGHVGVTIELDELADIQPAPDPVAALFTEELGALIQVREADLPFVLEILQQYQLAGLTHILGELNDTDQLRIMYHGQPFYEQSRTQLQRWWAQTSYRMQALRDNPACAEEEYAQLLTEDPGLSVTLRFDPALDICAPLLASSKARPRVAILREQGVNGYMEMAAAFARAGFACVDVHMTDILSGRVPLKDFVGIAAGGGFSYGDVLGAGRGWAQVILNHPQARAALSEFFQRPDTFTFGACNGCQMLAELKSLIPGAASWPIFKRNRSEQYEARLSLVKIEPSPSIFLREMAGSCLPVAVAHGEGRPEFANEADLVEVEQQQLVTLRYIDNHHQVTERYPSNPNGSVRGVTGLTTPDGRVLIVMPHPERVYRTQQNSWHPDEWGPDGPWLRLFRNARHWVG